MTERKRELWLDVLRILAAFLVIVNHTNSRLFIDSSPEHGTWWASISWYTLSKIAVPLFVMVSGAVLLPRQDSYRRTAARIGRVAAALLVFSYAYFAHSAWMEGSWQQMFHLPEFVRKVWTQSIADPFWYLYFYMGLLLMLPLLQRLAAAMRKGDATYLISICIGLNALWPLITHYVPQLELPSYFKLPMFSPFVGLFFLGCELRKAHVPTRRQMWVSAVVLVLSIAVNVLMMRLEYDRVAPGAQYWFIDNREQPALFTITAATACAILCKGWFSRPLPAAVQKAILAAGGAAFGVYLLHGRLIDLTINPVFHALCNHMPGFPAVIVWELFLFAISLAAALVLKRIPGLKKLL